MLIKNDFEVAQPVDKVWQFFDDIPQVAACLPGAELTDDLGDDKYAGRVAVRMGPVKLQFAGTAQIVERDDAAKRIVVDAAGADEKGRGQATHARHRARWRPAGSGTRVDVDAGPAAVRRGRAVRPRHDLRRHRGPHGDFATNMQTRIDAHRARRVAGPGRTADARPAASPSALRAMRLALGRVFRRFFLPYQPNPS